MADPLLTSLCAICHIAPPQYRCPRCDVRTCSLPCIRKHKSWASCSGERDPTVYIPPKSLKTAAGIDHDYNFLKKLERTVERTEKELVEERALVQKEELRPLTVRETKYKVGKDGRKRRVVVTRVLRETKGRKTDAALTRRLQAQGVNVQYAPTGMQRMTENTTTFNRKSGLIYWQVEWQLVRDNGALGERKLWKCYEDTPLYAGYHAIPGETTTTKKNQVKGPGRANRFFSQLPVDKSWNTVADMFQDPETGKWSLAAPIEAMGVWPAELDRRQRAAYDYYLANPVRQAGQARVVTKLDVDECLRDGLKDTNVLEFPTIFVLHQGMALPEGYVLGPKDFVKGPKRKAATDMSHAKGGKRPRKDREEGDVGSDKDDLMAGGLEAGEVVGEESFDENENEDGDDTSDTSSEGTSSEEE
ncbi:uncharacterized protein J7T54_004397 [Emericellopsis cladophorae]|uniref:Box C/D snoRNA protein 1 n=1 Tax=Emericellopsis cladophorae TaxID=2686198 RepID=A0A9P9Y4U4_9HYPO|nr:uncharacterized protein J7T54_004397 [Emericellopsis cladophorae]KAI6783370.1 hypothetical protein J7T54_004397 [Emericellopsis cladophorae]